LKLKRGRRNNFLLPRSIFYCLPPFASCLLITVGAVRFAPLQALDALLNQLPQKCGRHWSLWRPHQIWGHQRFHLLPARLILRHWTVRERALVAQQVVATAPARC
jgi:hypothetical protein